MTDRFIYIARLLAASWAALIFFLSSQPNTATELVFPGADKLMHAALFGVLGILVAGSLRPDNGKLAGTRVALAGLGVALYGILDEYHQMFVPGRTADIYDVFADVSGGLAGVCLVSIAYSRFTR